ncbi:MAG: AAA+-type ATPase [Piccolia ochrophora]|nr:MAG: AAA+-type ATPase [Piccolia ochrophora]
MAEAAPKPHHVHEYTVRPAPKSAQSDVSTAFRVYLAPTALRLHHISPGDPCVVSKGDTPIGTAIAWPTGDRIQETVVQTSRILQATFGLKLGERISLQRQSSSIHIADLIYVREVFDDKNEEKTDYGDVREDRHWEWLLEDQLDRVKYVAPGMMLDPVEHRTRKRLFEIQGVGEQDLPKHFLVSVGKQSRVRIRSSSPVEAHGRTRLKLSADDLCGVGLQVERLNTLLETFDGPRYSRDWLLSPSGILLHGLAGTGKSFIIKKIVSTWQGKTFNIEDVIKSGNSGDLFPRVRRMFAEAKTYHRCIIVIDQLDLVAPRCRPGEWPMGVASALSAELDDLDRRPDGQRILVLGATNRINEVDLMLRRPGRFEIEIEIPIPDRRARAHILKALSGNSPFQPDPLLDRIAEQTHGYVGADLRALIQRSGLLAELRERKQGTSETERALIPIEGHGMTREDVELALRETHPTAMREIFLEVPKVRWTDIGGQAEVKKALKETIEWQFKNPSRMQRLGIEPKKGLLLYGPPGCSKTLTAKALATESGLNFIAVKGAELLNMYVGESERALREMFAKARTASPSIIFFDEIDAIGGSRGEGQGSGLHVLTTLLNELDGIESLTGVTVLAATNKPETLDLALMRPGRLDTILYVGLPNQDAREEILKIKASKMDVAPDVDLCGLAVSMEGHTGAEIVNICEVAGYRAFEESEASGKEEQITMSDFAHGMAQVTRQITSAVLEKYRTWAADV